MERFASRVALDLGRTVLHQTGLKGTFDFEFKYAKDADRQDAGPSLLQAIQDQLGLKLVPAKRPVRMLFTERSGIRENSRCSGKVQTSCRDHSLRSKETKPRR
jgi:uncharacterized protein (TIGR03435 family)